MRPRNARSLTIVAGSLVLALAALGGCTTVTHEFHGHDPGHVWTAMQVVANNPEYRDWHVIENHVHVDGDEARIHIYRILERAYVRHGSRPWNEQIDWRFQVVLEDVDPPTARFLTRGVVIPTRSTDEGRRFFAEVRRMLRTDEAFAQPRPAPAPEPAPEAEPAPESEPADPADDLADLLEP